MEVLVATGSRGDSPWLQALMARMAEIAVAAREINQPFAKIGVARGCPRHP